MRPMRLEWRLFASHLLVSLIAIGVTAWLGLQAVERFYLEQVERHLRVTLDLLKSEVGPAFDADRPQRLIGVCKSFKRITSTRITVILPSGKVLFDTHQDAETMDNHSDRPEVRQALAGEVGASTRYSSTRDARATYVAVPLRRNGLPLAVLRAAMPVKEVDARLRSIQGRIAAGGVAVALVAAVISLLAARRIARPLDLLRRGAQRLADGDIEHSLAMPESDDLADVAAALNRMARQLKERVRDAARHTGQQQTVLASMTEGVLAVDTEERIISLNHAAAELLGTAPLEAQGRGLPEVIRNADLHRFVAGVLSLQGPAEGDVAISPRGDRVLQVHGSALRDASGHTIGAVIVLNDVTRLRQLETLRRDFVANVSHELRTPITSIKGFVETLLDGALNDADDARRFLQIIARQADRLNAIIEDLLSLSKIEQGEETGEIALEDRRLLDVLQAAVHDCQPAAAERRVRLAMTCDEALRARINQPLLEQAVVNLLDNAIKYSEPEQDVQLVGVREGDEVTIAVSDQGCGIAAEHLPRLFERFYRVDRGRSRKLGGTGLGLAIVKHIVQAHRGRITVESTPGQGSVFTVRLPV